MNPSHPQAPQPAATSADASASTPTQARLSAYAASASAVGVGVLGAVGLAGGADAGVIYSGVQDTSIARFSALFLDLDGDTATDIVLKNYDYGSNYQGAAVSAYPGKAVGFFSSGGIGYAAALSAGDVIDTTTTAGGPVLVSLAFGSDNPNAQFNNANGAFIGLEFPIAGVSHFGWLRVTIDNAAGTFVLKDWAYQADPGVGIAAGVVPEPATLALLAAGSAGLLGYRARKETLRDEEAEA